MTMTFPAPDRRTLLVAALAAIFLSRVAVAAEGRRPSSQEPTDMRIRMMFAGRTMTATLYDNPSARDFHSMLPLDLTIDDYSTNEKIAYLPRKLTEDGSGPFGNERSYDICYFKPWGNLALFHADYTHAGLIRLGRFDEGFEALHVRGAFPLRIEAIS
ncbi:cyclophilin-like fold protein [Methylobrevis albus]|uniref:MFS transporter n=1 Tax=Methylobrevis albus TaxID=2793297 RepID=A0A931I4E3_9HYPH|nr:cyclophilin-like fold protein [Methylobrevis albus]MBH0239041.1 MFS transporter [Methylobrevis albus]